MTYLLHSYSLNPLFLVFSSSYAYSDEDAIQIASIDTTLENEFLNKVHEIFQRELANDQFEIPRISEELDMSHSKLYRKIKALTGNTVVSYLRSYRLHKSVELLTNSSQSIAEVAYAVGFNDPSYFTKMYTKEFGHSPKDASGV